MPYVHFLQSGTHGARVFDEYSTRATATRLWGRVSGSPAPGGLPPGAAPITAARRPSWHVEHTHVAPRGRCASRLNRVVSAQPVWGRPMRLWSHSGAVPLAPGPTSAQRRGHRRPNVEEGDTDHERNPSRDLCPGRLRPTD